jgi:hypothetical protein
VNSQNTANGVNSKSLNDEIDWVYHVGDIRYDVPGLVDQSVISADPQAQQYI